MKCIASQESNTSFELLEPPKVLSAVEQSGLLTTGRFMALNSLENRVYLVELENAFMGDTWIVAKFYRPKRWSREALLEEHAFLRQLREEEILVGAPIDLQSGSTIGELQQEEIPFALFPRLRGRVEFEFDDETLQKLGRLIARIHLIGSRTSFIARPHFTIDEFVKTPANFLLHHRSLPPDYQSVIHDLNERIIRVAERELGDLPLQRIHGDFHLGNVLWNQGQCLLVDFDDCFEGPAIHDLWLPANGDAHSLEVILESYREIRNLSPTSERTVLALRAIRVFSFRAWALQRWEDNAFREAFPDFCSQESWRSFSIEMSELLRAVDESDAIL